MSENFNSYSDQELLKYMRGRNKAISDEAFKAIYSRYAPRVHAYCLKILNSREQAEDVFQETFI
ncbi:MAG: RNA polymerase sigma factor, partial [Bacteroidota bacterium]